MPDPVLLSIATAVVSKAVTGLYEMVKAKFAGDPVATAALEAAVAEGEGSPAAERLGEVLERTERQDPEFVQKLRDEVRNSTTVTQSGHVSNQLNVTGATDSKFLQAGDVQGGVSF